MQASVRYRDFWGAEKRALLEATLAEPNFDEDYKIAAPVAINRFSFRPTNIGAEYLKWPRILDMCLFTINGLMEKRANALIAHRPEVLAARMQAYFDKEINWNEWKQLGYGLTKDRARFDAKLTRDKLLKNESFDESRIGRYAVRPLDTQWCYYSGVRPLWNEPRPQLFAQVWHGNQFLISRQKGAANPEGVPMSFCTVLGDDHYVRDDAYYVPFLLKTAVTAKKKATQQGHFAFLGKAEHQDEGEKVIANLSKEVSAYLLELGFSDPDSNNEVAALPWFHALAIGFSTEYLEEHADGIRSDWPRIPLPSTRTALEESAALGQEIAKLLDTETSVPGVTSGVIREELKLIGQLAKRKLNGEFGAQITSEEDLKVVGWGSVQSNGTIMRGAGKIEEVDEAADWGSLLNIYLNDFVCWRNIPTEVWEFTLGGFQIIKKWLSYREHGSPEKPVLGRPLTKEEVRYVQEMVRRLAAIVLMQEQIENNYQAVISNARGI